MDLSKLNMTEHADKGAKMQVLHPATGEVLDGVTITLLGDDCTLQKQRYAELRRNAFKNKNQIDKALDRAEETALDLRISKTIAWEGIDWNGGPFECTPENVRKIYSDPGFSWLVEQVDRFTAERSNFLSNADKR